MNDFYLVYQPKVRANKIIAVEALLRPYRTDINSYFQNLNDTLSLDKKVILECLREFTEYGLVYPVSLNVHPTSLFNDDFIDFCIETISDRMVTLELIETQNIKVCEQLRRNASRLQSSNIKLSIDDFCFEYSRLDLAMEIETDEIKFDGSLIKDIDSSFFKFKYLLTLHAKFCKLGIKNVVFEKVETRIQYDLISLFCDDAIIQGFYFYKPMRMNDLIKEELTICDSYNAGHKFSLSGIRDLDFFVYRHITDGQEYNKNTVNEVIKKHDKIGTVYNEDADTSLNNLGKIHFDRENVVNNSVMSLLYNADKLLLFRNDQGMVLYDNLAHRTLLGFSLIGVGTDDIVAASESYAECLRTDNILISSSQNFLTTNEVFDDVLYGVVREKMFYNDRPFVMVNAAKPDADIIVNMPDPLTQCYTRGYLDQLVNRYNNKILGFVDLNGFKAVNDKFGHAVGDKCIIDFVQILKSKLRCDDVVIRYGGDEFLILFDSTSLEAIASRLGNVNTIVESHFRGKAIELSFAYGLEILDDQNVEQSIKNADAKMYKAKEAFKQKQL